MQSLSKLDISCNSLTTLPMSILQAPNLTFLNLRKNRLSGLPNRLFVARVGTCIQAPSPQNLVTIDARENEFRWLPCEILGPVLGDLKTGVNPWLSKEEVFENGSEGEEGARPLRCKPKLLDIVCTRILQSTKLRPVLQHATEPIYQHILSSTCRCVHCQMPFTHDGIACYLWRPTTDSTEVPFRGKVCSEGCLSGAGAVAIS
jgi:Leucine-rich repeat (LRR) protein